MIKNLLAAAILSLLPGITTAQIAVDEEEPAPVFEDVNISEMRDASTLPKPTNSDRVEPFQIGVLRGYRLGDSVLIAATFDRLEKPYSEYMVAQKQKKQGIINGKGEILLPFEFDHLEKFEFEILRNDRPRHRAVRWLIARKGDKFGLIDPAGREVAAFEWDRVQYTYGDTLLLLSRPGLQRLIGPSEQVLLETNYEDWDMQNPFPEPERKFILAIKNGKMGMIDRQNRVILPFEFERIDWVDGNLACVENDQNRKGLVNLQGQELIAPQYLALAKPDQNGLLMAALGENQGGLLDTTGRTVIPFEYSICKMYPNIPQCYLLKKNERYGLANAAGKIVLPIEMPTTPSPLGYFSVRWENDVAGIRATQNDRILDQYFTVQLAPTELALYHVERGLIIKGDYFLFQVFNDAGPILASQTENRMTLFNLNGQVLLQGEYQRVYANTFRTVIFARLPDRRYQIFGMDGKPLSENFFNNFWNDGGQSLPNGYFALSDAADKFALFDPFGQRLTPYRYINLKKVSDKNLRIAQEKGYLKPGRTLVALGMTEITERKVIGWHWLDDTGAVVNE